MMKYLALGFPLTLLFTSFLFSLNNQAEASKEFTVGGNLGWRIPDSNDTDVYNHWAETRRFHVGDTLRFVYTNDSVIEVDKYDYYHCKTAAALNTYTDGNSSVKLTRSGMLYYISGSADHCANGQRIIVDVMSPHIHISSPPTSDDDHHYSASAPASVTSAAEQPSVALVSSLAAAAVVCSLLTASY